MTSRRKFLTNLLSVGVMSLSVACGGGEWAPGAG